LVSLVDPTKVVARLLPNSVVGADAVLVRTWPAVVAAITCAGRMAVFLYAASAWAEEAGFE
jgi:hypothetical protein